MNSKERSENNDIFLSVLHALNDIGILSEIMLIGSWALPVYRTYFGDAPEIPLLRTLDLDFLGPYPFKMNDNINVSEVLEHLEFKEIFSATIPVSKYIYVNLCFDFPIKVQYQLENIY